MKRCLILSGLTTPFISVCAVVKNTEPDMCWGDVTLCEDAKGNEYLEYTERQTKTRSGIDTSNVRNVSPKMFSTGGEQDPVAVRTKFTVRSDRKIC